MQQNDSSFRDPAGYVFNYKGEFYRSINISGKDAFDEFIRSGLYDSLLEKGMIVSHSDVTEQFPSKDKKSYKIIYPNQIPYISYSYEWSFSQFKAAALLTLRVQLLAMKFGMSLKDASSYNVQFIGANPLFIDTLSFERYNEKSPWVAYRQFCEHFLVPLVMATCTDIRVNKLLVSNIDGIPLELAIKLLPFHKRLDLGIFLHIYLHAKAQKKYNDVAVDSNTSVDVKSLEFSKIKLERLLESLVSKINSLTWKHPKTEWGDYYTNTNYIDVATKSKRSIVDSMLKSCGRSTVIHDIGANEGEYTNIAEKHSEYVIAHDIDYVSVDKLFQSVRRARNEKILPLVLDLCNPSPAIGWRNKERMSFNVRLKGDVILLLAVIHHLVISNCLSFKQVSEFLATRARWLIIEFVPAEDSQAIRISKTREVLGENYCIDNFRETFGRVYDVMEEVQVESSLRVIFRMKSKVFLNSGLSEI